jgi:hypothetical protein
LTYPRSLLNWGIVADAERGVVRCSPYRSKVAILGAHPGSRALAPLDDPEWEVWAMNSMVHRDRGGRVRADRCFELHPLAAQSERDWAFLRDPPAPVYLFEPDARVPGSVRYPIGRVEEAFGIWPGRPGDLFACTMAYQVALAILERFETIAFFGVELDQGTPRERTVERTSLAWWCGMAAGRRIEVRLPFGSTMLTHPLRYGYDYEGEVAWTRRFLDFCAHWTRMERRGRLRSDGGRIECPPDGRRWRMG